MHWERRVLWGQQGEDLCPRTCSAAATISSTFGGEVATKSKFRTRPAGGSPCAPFIDTLSFRTLSAGSTAAGDASQGVGYGGSDQIQSQTKPHSVSPAQT